MWRFVLQENIRRFRALNEHADSDEQRETLRQLLEEAELELDKLEQASTPEIAKRDAALKYLADHAVDQAMALRGAQFASLQIFDEDRAHLIILAQRNLRVGFLHHLAQVKPGDGSACGRCLADDAPAAIEDVNRDPRFEPYREIAKEARIQAVAAFPVRDSSGNLLAVLSTYFEAPQRFSDDDLHRMTVFAQSIGSTLEKHLAANAQDPLERGRRVYRG